MAHKLREAFLKPAPGRMVRDPLTLKMLDNEGELKSLTIYWVRRLRDEDVVEMSAPKAEATSTKAEIAPEKTDTAPQKNEKKTTKPEKIGKGKD